VIKIAIFAFTESDFPTKSTCNMATVKTEISYSQKGKQHRNLQKMSLRNSVASRNHEKHNVQN